MTRIFVFGDSLSYGAWDKEGGWVQRLRKFLDQKTISENGYYVLYNLSVSGNNTELLLKRFEFELKQRLKEEDEDNIVIFAIGGNDSRYLNKKENLQTTAEEFRRNVGKLIRLSKKFTSKIIFVGITPLDESKTLPIPWSPTKYYTTELVKRNNEILKSVCKENKVHFIEIFDKMIKDYKKFLDEDGLHLNTEGHELTFEIVRDFLIKNKIITT